MRRVIGLYPDGGRVTPEYVAAMVSLFGSLDHREIEALMDQRSGIMAKCKFLPSVPEVNQLVEERRARFATVNRLAERVGARVPEKTPATAYRPFPKLYAAFEDQPWLLRRGFEALFDASRALAMQGKDAALTVLKHSKGLD